MNDDVLTKTGHAQPDAARLAAFALFVLFVALVVLLGIGLTLYPREIPSPLTPQMLQDKVLPLIRELRK